MTKSAMDLPRREEVPSTQTWDLSPLYSSFEDWEKSFAKLPKEEELTKEINEKFKGKLAKSAQVIHDALTRRDELSRMLANLYVYANLRLTEDVGNPVANDAAARISIKHTSLMSLFSFMEPELLKVEQLSTWVDKEQILQTYVVPLRELLRQKEHVLSEKEEALLARFSLIAGKFSSIHSMWNNVDLTFPPAVDKDGKEHLVSNSRYNTNLESPDRELRKSTYNSYYSEISKWRNTIGENLFSAFQSGSVFAKARGFSSFIESSLFPDNIPVSIYDTLIQSTRNNISYLHQSMDLRRNVLGLDKVQPYDRGVSLAKVEPVRFSWEEACDLVLTSLAPLGDEYVAAARAGLKTERWVDFAENKGKRSGAFSWGSYDSKPYMLVSWTGTVNDLFTLAHELGHSMHSLLSWKNQPYHLSEYTIFVAEVASTLCEQLLARHLLSKEPGTPLAAQILAQRLRNMEGTVYRQVQFAAFEREVGKRVDNDEAVTPDLLGKIYMDLNKEWYGESCEFDDLIANEWMRIPHFYSTFYVYKYATSYCAALDLATRLESNPEKTRGQILEFLKTGGSKLPLDTLLAAGVDFNKEETFTNAFKAYQTDLKTASNLFGREL